MRVYGAVLPADVWPDAAHQKQLLESVHSMIDELEKEKRNFVATVDTQQVQSQQTELLQAMTNCSAQ